ncbi:hypothetical protein NS115_17860 [Paenibacillus jamilae]|uniref:Uncharacterized protein n=1 Tax=Paenibacillus jamilae TaxID=114136 RepID=A0ACC4ZRT7_9BACL|nr:MULTISPECIES: hypothetical protein [Paenibacillus]AJE53083.1 hypothetical protein RE92_19620 [Paenibacillus polymyxa]AUO07904.1 hypothetical protein C0638_15890 [Paenibacillus sp. lzh-N1]KTS80988.1 hypothetical protein NS115_17860 [Paenibacillus jamilae]QOH63073.1 hypothetical protein DI243_17360 [Paenibacillus polymyxa]
MKKHNTFSIILLTVVAVLALSACGTKPQTNNNAPQGADQPQTQQPQATPEPVAEPQVKKGTGVYNGAADPHTVEIETNGEAQSFQLGEGLDTVIAGLKEGDPVAFEYTEKAVEGDATAKQLTLTKIQKTEASTDSNQNGSSGQQVGGDRAKTQTFELNLEGKKEKQTATLAKGEGYSLYVFDPMSLFPDQNRVALAVDDNYYAEITKLPSNFNLDELQKDGEKDLASIGKVQKLDKAAVPQALTSSRLFLQANGSKITQQYIVVENTTGAFSVKVNIPHGEPAEGFESFIYTSLESLQANK